MRFLKAMHSFALKNFGISEFLFLGGMVLLYTGAAVILSPAWGRVLCGAVLIIVGVLLGRESES